jgi:uncharacterized protein (DUF2252 family)
VSGVAMMLAAMVLWTSAAEDPASSRAIVPDPARLADAPADLREKLAASPVAYFRFVNQPWTREACAAFLDATPDLPTSHLHGDAHVEQYAFTAHARGLDDFDDSARGPAVVDIVRFLGSLELTAASRGWLGALDALSGAFFAGYQRALDDPSYLPADPGVVTRLRAVPVRPAPEFLAWATSLMRPLSADDAARVDEAWPRVVAHAAQLDPTFTREYLHRKDVGWLRLGVGSALSRKVLFRVEGPSPAPEDDVVLEAKEVTALREETCLKLPQRPEVFRIVEGVEQVGRLEQRLLVALPTLMRDATSSRGWWVREWDPSYRELEIADLASAVELQEVAHDVGAQLGRVNLVTPSGAVAGDRRRQRQAISDLAPRMRQVAHDLAGRVLAGWRTVAHP